MHEKQGGKCMYVYQDHNLRASCQGHYQMLLANLLLIIFSITYRIDSCESNKLDSHRESQKTRLFAASPGLMMSRNKARSSDRATRLRARSYRGVIYCGAGMRRRPDCSHRQLRNVYRNADRTLLSVFHF